MNVHGDHDNVTLDLDDSNDCEQKEDDGDDDSTNFCHTCLIVDKTCNLKDITKPYAYNGNYEIYSDMLEYCFSLQPGHETNVPYNIYMICETCIKSLRIAANFRHLIENAQETINEVLEGGLPESFPKDYQGCLNASKFGVRINPTMNIIEDIYPIKIRDIKTKHMCNEDKSRIIGGTNEEINNLKTERRQKEFFIDYRMKLKPSDQHWKCNRCSKRFSCYSKRAKHIEDVHGFTRSVYKCTVCDLTFTSSGKRSTHIRMVHLRERNHICPVCKRAFFTRRGLQLHITTHTGRRNYPCDVCYKAFSRKSALTQHMKFHASNKDYVCHICDAAFAQKSILKEHMNTHLLRDYKEEICDYEYQD